MVDQIFPDATTAAYIHDNISVMGRREKKKSGT